MTLLHYPALIYGRGAPPSPGLPSFPCVYLSDVTNKGLNRVE